MPAASKVQWDLILASGSPRRAQMLRDRGWAFTIAASAAPESEPEYLSPAETAMANAWRKTAHVARAHLDKLVVGADTVVSLEGRHFGKPGSLAEAEEMLAALQGRVHQVATGVCLIHRRRRVRRLFAETTAVRFHSLNPAQIRRYLSRIQPLDKAGGYAIQDEGASIVECIHGSYSNVVGLPIERLETVLAEIQQGVYRPSAR